SGQAASSLHIEAAHWIEDESCVVVGELPGHQHLRPEYMIIGNLPKAVHRKIGVRIVLVESRRRRVKHNPGRARAAPVLDFESVEIEEADHVFRCCLPVQLDCRILELSPVYERAGVAYETDVLDGIRTVEPCMVPPDRTANLGAIIRNLPVVIASGMCDACCR